MTALAVVLAGSCACLAPARAAVPDYQVLTIPSPQPQASSSFGERLRSLKDVDGDGAGDVLVSSSNFDGDDAGGGVLANSGRLYIFSGRTGALLRALEPPFPQANGRFGFWDAGLGDVDGDGAGDFATSAPGQVLGGLTLGQVYIYSGRTGIRLRTISPPEPLTPVGGFGGDFGGNLIGPGDLNGDGIGDVVVTASGAFAGAGAAYAFNGRTGAFLYKVANPDPVQASAFGFGAAESDDVNGDGAGDYQIGAPRFDEGPLADVGRAYVINGRTGAVMYTLRDPEPEANNRFGQADADGVAPGDVTGDGVPDIYVDTFLANDAPAPTSPPLPDAGKAHLFSGATGALIRTLHDPMPEGVKQFGASNASAGDIDRDGWPDQLISSRGGNHGRVQVFGGPGLSTLLTTFQDPGDAQTGALFGTGLASPGDVNADGLPDYYISARGADVGGAADVGVMYAFRSVAPPAIQNLGSSADPISPAPGATPSDPVPAARRGGRLSARVTPAADRRAPYRFVVSGRLTLPGGIARSAGCRGRVSVQVKRGATTISTRRVSLTRTCTYSLR
ncbi:MAG TPA: hypothetical protein VGV67_12655, partial [Solirubrobacteraceae bacterium]|nr:hypothetical protein [Solirubrobacteraceae bacterium]